MTLKLIYHTPVNMEGGVSPFDDSVMDIITGGEVSIAAPYLTLSYLRRILKLTSGWRLLTDVDAWLCSQAHDMEGIERIERFILDHTECVRHRSRLHAKVLIGGKKAIVGSANFTDAGIKHNVEMSVELDVEEQIQELQEWFNLHWSECNSISKDALHSSVASVRPTVPSGYKCLPSEGPEINSTLRPLPRNVSVGEQPTELATPILHEKWRERTENRGPQHLSMLAIYSALGPDRVLTDTIAVSYWNFLKSLELSAWRKYDGETRRNFRVKMSEHALLVNDSDGFRLAPGVSAETLGVPLNVYAAAKTVVTAVDNGRTASEIRTEYADELRVLDESTVDV